MDELSLRQRKKNRTRAALRDVSRRLFEEQGYEATTLEQIAQEAEVSVPTLLAYFESKDRLALATEFDALDGFRERVQDPDRGASTLALWREMVERGAKGVLSRRRAYLRHLEFLDSAPVLARASLALLQGYEDVLANGIAADHGTDPDADLATRLMATTLSFGNEKALRGWYAEGGRGDLAAAVLAVVDFVIERFPRPGVGADL